MPPIVDLIVSILCPIVSRVQVAKWGRLEGCTEMDRNASKLHRYKKITKSHAMSLGIHCSWIYFFISPPPGSRKILQIGAPITSGRCCRCRSGPLGFDQ